MGKKNLWFIDPLDGHTKEVVIRYLGQVGATTDPLEIYVSGEVEPINAYYAQYRQIMHLRRRIEDQNLKFRAIFSHSVDGPFWVSKLWEINKPGLEKKRLASKLEKLKKKQKRE